jgi:hypothetical protein
MTDQDSTKQLAVAAIRLWHEWRDLALELDAEVERLRADRRQLRARLVECRQYIGFVPWPNTKGMTEMLAIRDLADDTLDEVRELPPRVMHRLLRDQ